MNYSEPANRLENPVPVSSTGSFTGKRRTGAKPLSALSLFSGGGGLDLGFSAADFRVGCSSDAIALLGVVRLLVPACCNCAPVALARSVVWPWLGLLDAWALPGQLSVPRMS